jgi:uncharacterized protein YdeI (BOF family)
MKKIAILFAFMLICTIGFGQTLILTLANGSVGVDSISGSTTTYFYANGQSGTTNSIASPCRLKAQNQVKIQGYEVSRFIAGTAHSLVTASDSTAITWEASVDNTNWFPVTVYPTNAIGTGGGANTIYAYTTYALLRYALWVPTAGSMVYPYYRVKMVNSTTGRKYPGAWIILKKL